MFYLEKNGGRVYVKKSENGFYTLEDFKVRVNSLETIADVLSHSDEDIKRVVYFGIASNIANRLKIDTNINDYDVGGDSLDDLMFCFSKMLKEVAITINETTVLPFDYALFIKILKSLVSERLKLFATNTGIKKEAISILFNTGLSNKDIEMVKSNEKEFLKGYYLLTLY